MRTFIVLLALVVIAFFVWKLGWLHTSTPSTTQTTTQTSTQTSTAPAGSQMEDGTINATVSVGVNTVTYDGTKFTPSTITVKQGDSVTFVNNSSGGMEVASNPHPTHTIYPEFDQTKSSSAGSKTYTFQFGKVGTWGYHNHNNPSVGGTVVVTAQ